MHVAAYVIFGAIVGSFLNVLIVRRGTGYGLRGRSACASCKKRLAAHDLIPVVSWMALRGRCRHCGSAISVQYPLVEGVTSVLFGVVGGMALPLLSSALACAMVASLVAIATYDIRHTIIPDAWVGVYVLCASSLAFAGGAHPLLIAIGAGVCATPFFMMWFLSRGRAMGLGDAKLALGIGALLGVPLGLFAAGLSFVLGSAFFLPLLAVSHMRSSGRPALRVTMKSEVPFGPFLTISFLLVWVTEQYGYSLPGFLGLVW